MTQGSRDKLLQALHFTIGNVRVSIGLEYVEKVLSLVELEHVPGGPPYLIGLMNVSGKIIPAIDLCIYLGLSREAEYSLETPLIICSNNKNCIAILVDTITDISAISTENANMQESFNNINMPFLAVITHDDAQSLLLDINKLLTDDLMNVTYRVEMDMKHFPEVVTRP